MAIAENMEKEKTAMNETIQAILDIDRSTRELKENTAHVLEEEMNNTRMVMAELQREANRQMREQAEKQVQAIEQKRKEDESALVSTSEEQIEVIWRFFDAHREKMAAEWFARLRDDNGI